MQAVSKIALHPRAHLGRLRNLYSGIHYGLYISTLELLNVVLE